MQLVEKELKTGKIAYYCALCGSPVRVTMHGAICTGCGTTNPPCQKVSKEDIKNVVITILRKRPDVGLVNLHRLTNYLLGISISEDLMNEVFVELGLL